MAPILAGCLGGQGTGPVLLGKSTSNCRRTGKAGRRHPSHSWCFALPQRRASSERLRRRAVMLPVGVGTRNVPQDSPSPPARVEQGTMASKPARSEARHPHPAVHQPETAARRAARRSRTNPATVAQPRDSRPRHLANLTPAGVPILAPSRFANPSPVTSPAGRRPFCIFDARHPPGIGSFVSAMLPSAGRIAAGAQ